MFLLRILFGNLFFAVTLFLNNSIEIGGSTLTGKILIFEVLLPTEACQGIYLASTKY